MKASTLAINRTARRLAIGASSLVIASMTIGATATAAASQHNDTKDHKKNQGSVQHNKNQRNTRNYNITYNINYYFNNRSQKPQQSSKANKPNDRYAFPGHMRSETPPESTYSQKIAKPTSSHNSSMKQNRVYTQTRWVYDPRLCRWVEIGYNKSTKRWELTYQNDRTESRRDNPSDDKNFSYWYNN